MDEEKVLSCKPETVAKLLSMRPIDDNFFRLLSGREGVCQEIIDTLLPLSELKVSKATPQYRLVGLNRDAITDVLCEMLRGGLVNIEVQKRFENDDLRRTRFHASLITSNFTPKSTMFSEVPDVKVIYISEYDSLGTGKPVAKVSKERLNADGSRDEVINGEEIYFATSAVKDDSKASRLLQRMVDSTAFQDDEFPHLSEAVRYYKCTKEGNNTMCQIMDEIVEEIVEERVEEIVEERAKNEKLKLLVSQIAEGLFTLEYAVRKYGFTEQELRNAMKQQ